MKKGLALLVVIFLVIAMGSSAFAAGGGTASPGAPGEKVLVIDNNNLYAGMDKTYSNGYLPAVANGTATIILPLVPSKELQGNKIDTTVDLGDPATSPFVFRSYDKTVSLAQHNVNNNSNTVSAYVVELSLPMTDGRVNGRYAVTVNVSGQVKGGSQFTQAFTVYVTVTDGQSDTPAGSGQDVPPGGGDADLPAEDGQDAGGGDAGGGGGGSGESAPAPQPKVIISSYSVNPSPVLAGQESVSYTHLTLPTKLEV